MTLNRIRRFFFPSLTLRFGKGLFAAISAYLFGAVLILIRIQGTSMEPTYRNGGMNFAGSYALLRNLKDTMWSPCVLPETG
jgi:hypothetical protein